jgi:hypothetical protein
MIAGLGWVALILVSLFALVALIMTIFANATLSGSNPWQGKWIIASAIAWLIFAATVVAIDLGWLGPH